MEALFSVLDITQSNLILFGKMATRGLVIYFSSIVLLRINKRFTGIRTPFNFILFVMLGSISANAIVGKIPFLPVFGVIVFLILLNRIIAIFVFFFPPLERFIKGPTVLLAKRDDIQWINMKKNYITKNDLFTELRKQLHTDDISSVDFTTLATDGEIHFIKREKKHKTPESEQFKGDLKK